jgi:hypothetical protein
MRMFLAFVTSHVTMRTTENTDTGLWAVGVQYGPRRRPLAMSPRVGRRVLCLRDLHIPSRLALKLFRTPQNAASQTGGNHPLRLSPAGRLPRMHVDS